MLSLTLSLALAISPGLVPGDYCDSPGERTAWTRERRRQTFDRVDAAARELGASPIIRAYLRVIAERESRGVASVLHTQGVDELGYGPLGLSGRWHRDKLEGEPDPAFCSPEASVIVATEIMHRAWVNYGARTVLELQSVYSGRWDCHSHAWCIFTLSLAKRRDLCARMRERGFKCDQELQRRDLGARLPIEDRLAWALAAARRWLASSPLAR